MLSDEGSDPIAKRIGFGCGRLNGGTERRESIRLIRAALDCGIGHFDVAPSYGFGAAENVLGEALAKSGGAVTVATKVGLPRPAKLSLMNVARTIVKPVSRVVPGLRAAALNALSKRPPSRNFSIDYIRDSFQESQRLLRRECIDYLLLHEVTADVELAALEDIFASYQGAGVIRAYGSSSGDAAAKLVHFGEISQYRCPLPDEDAVALAPIEIVHGAFRFVSPTLTAVIAQNSPLRESVIDLLPSGYDLDEARGAIALAYVLEHHPGRVLISTKSDKRLIATVDILRGIVSAPQCGSVMAQLRVCCGLAAGTAMHTGTL